MKKTLIILLTGCLWFGNSISQTTTPLWKTMPELSPMPKADDSGFAKVNDIKLYYAVFNKQGTDPVILLHGGLGSSDYWSFEVPLLAKTHKVVIMDSRGHGRSSMSEAPFSYNLLASDVLQLMNYLQIKKASIVGWSDGGIIGLILAIQHPERINKLFTYGSNFNHSGDKSEMPDSATAAKFMAKAEANYRKLSPTPDSFKTFRSGLWKMYSTEPNLQPADIKTIKAPTVIACGQYEQFYKLDHFQTLANLIPNARLVILPNVSHGGPIQAPEQFHEAVIKLLGDNE